jgi:Permuted papain-like amidase enzyme, YaeF/YiiX, C92 family
MRQKYNYAAAIALPVTNGPPAQQPAPVRRHFKNRYKSSGLNLFDYFHNMAEVLTKKQLREIRKVPYEKIRDFLKTGQLVFCSGNYLFSGIIQKLTKSTWSHVAIVYKDEELGRVLILEAEPFVGIRLIPLSKYLKDYKGKKRPYKGMIFISELTVPITREQLNRGISFGLDELTRPYDNWEIFRIMLRILFRRGKRERNRNYICSELVRDCFARAGVVFPMTDTYISPDAIWKDARVAVKWRVL